MSDLEHILQSPLLPPSQVSRGAINKQSQTFKESEPNEAALMKSHEAAKESFQASISNSPDLINSGLHHKYRNSHGHGLHQQRKECDNINNENNGKPVIESINRTVIVLVGSQISLSARFCCSPRPKKVYWIHRHLAIMPSRIIGPYITKELIMVCIHAMLLSMPSLPLLSIIHFLYSHSSHSSSLTSR